MLRKQLRNVHTEDGDLWDYWIKVAFKEKGREKHRWMEMLQVNTKPLQYLVMLKIQFMSVDNYEEKKLFRGRHFLSWNSPFFYMILHATVLPYKLCNNFKFKVMNNYYIINFDTSLYSVTPIKKARNEVFTVCGQVLKLTDISLKLLMMKLQ